jgi:hypothetical protein
VTHYMKKNSDFLFHEGVDAMLKQSSKRFHKCI